METTIVKKPGTIIAAFVILLLKSIILLLGFIPLLREYNLEEIGIFVTFYLLIITLNTIIAVLIFIGVKGARTFYTILAFIYFISVFMDLLDDVEIIFYIVPSAVITTTLILLYNKKSTIFFTNKHNYTLPSNSTHRAIQSSDRKGLIEDTELEANLQELKFMIDSQKSKLFATGVNQDITNFIATLVNNKNNAIDILRYYQKLFGKDLIKELSKLTNSYTEIKHYLKKFIELEIVESEYPHKINK